MSNPWKKHDNIPLQRVGKWIDRAEISLLGQPITKCMFRWEFGGDVLPQTRLFIGSSSAAKSQTKAVIQKFTSATLKFLPWWEAFTPGKTLLEDLDSIRDLVDGAVLIFSPEASSRVRGKTVEIPNLNVLFEFGYFYGHFGKQKVSIIKYGEYYLPSDFGGYIHISGSSFFKRSAVTQVGKRTENEFDRWIQAF